MAILKSIILEDSRGKVGNIVTYRLNGQQIAREWNPEPYDPQTPAQMQQRAKLANAVMVYQVLRYFLQFTQMLRKSTETTYNMLVRLFIAYMDTFKRTDGFEAMQNLEGRLYGFSSWLNITYCQLTGSIFNVYFDSQGKAYESGSRLELISWVSGMSQPYVRSIEVTPEMWTNGSITGIDLNVFVKVPCCYLRSENGLSCSNISFLK